VFAGYSYLRIVVRPVREVPTSTDFSLPCLYHCDVRLVHPCDSIRRAAPLLTPMVVSITSLAFPCSHEIKRCYKKMLLGITPMHVAAYRRVTEGYVLRIDDVEIGIERLGLLLMYSS
jgi:hypothetical protein